MKKKYLLVTACFLMLFSFGANAQHEGHDHGDHATEDGHDDDHGHGDMHKHHAALFLGATTMLEDNVTALTAGFDYEYRISKRFGVGLAAEFLTSSHGQEIVYGIPFFYHTGSFKVVVAPMGAYIFPVNDGVHKTDAKMNYGGRIGVAYDFHIGPLSITPTVNYDYIESSAIVYGIGIGMGF